MVRPLSAETLHQIIQKPANSGMAGFFIFLPFKESLKKVIFGVIGSVSGKI